MSTLLSVKTRQVSCHHACAVSEEGLCLMVPSIVLAVLDFKTRLFPEEARAGNLPRLFFSGRELRDSQKCVDAGLRDGNVVHAMMRQAAARPTAASGPSSRESGSSHEGNVLFVFALLLICGAWYLRLQKPELFQTPAVVMLGILTAVFSIVSIQTIFKVGGS